MATSIDVGEALEAEKAVSLQDAFLEFRKKKQVCIDVCSVCVYNNTRGGM